MDSQEKYQGVKDQLEHIVNDIDGQTGDGWPAAHSSDGQAEKGPWVWQKPQTEQLLYHRLVLHTNDITGLLGNNPTHITHHNSKMSHAEPIRVDINEKGLNVIVLPWMSSIQFSFVYIH